ncbi:MAG: ABC transporter permease subunit [Tepidiformaceae bacterium]
MRDALRAELFKSLHRRMTYILLAVLCLLVLTFYVILWLRLRAGPETGIQGQLDYLAQREAMSFKNVVPYGLQLERFFLTLVCVVFTATMMGNEYDWRTVGVVVARGVKRWQFIAAKLVVSAGFAIVVLAAGFVVALVCSAWFSHLYHLSFGTFSSGRVLDLFASLVRTTYVVVPFVLMALLFATIWRSAGQAVGFSLGFFFLEGVFTGLLENASGWLAHVPEVLLNANAMAVMRANGLLSTNAQDRSPFAAAPGGVPVWRGFGVLLLYSAVFAAVAFWRFQRRDIQE